MESSQKRHETVGGKLCNPWKLSRNRAAKRGCSRGPWAMQPQRIAGATADKKPNSLATGEIGLSHHFPVWSCGCESRILRRTSPNHPNWQPVNEVTLVFCCFFFSLPFCPESETSRRAEEGSNKGGRRSTLTFNMWEGKWLRTSSIATIFSFHWGKYYFIHAISVHSSAGASLDSQCHLHTNILINGSDVSTACSWGVAVGGITWSNEGIYNKVALTVVLKTFTQLYISASAAAIQTYKPHNWIKNRKLFFFLLPPWCWSQAEERERGGK